MKTLRWYQDAAIQAIYGYFQLHTGHPLIVLPTGSGKSLVLAEFIRQVLTAWPDQRILMLTHVKELIEQNYLALLAQWPQAAAGAGIHSAGLNRRDTEQPILFAGIQSVHKKAMQLGWFDLVLIDEAHLLPPAGEGQYRTYLNALSEINPDAKVIGFTATPYRLGQGMLTSGPGRVFTDIAYDGTDHLLRLIDEGYLSRLVAKKTDTEYDLSGVDVRKGEYVANQLAEAMDRQELTRAAVAEIAEAGLERKSWLVFAAGVEHAQHIGEELRRLNIAAAVVTGEMPARERDRTLTLFRQGQFRAVVNVGVLTTGFDHPGIDLIALLRATKSPGLHVQMLGRGLRVAPGKQDCLVLDFAGNVREHGPLDRVRPPKARSMGSDADAESGEPPTKNCPECKSLLHISVPICPDCGHQFPPPPAPHQAHAFGDSPLSEAGAEAITELAVTDVLYSKHEKPNKPPSLRVDYHDGYRRVASEWVCLEHEGFAGRKALSWWSKRDPSGDPPPATVDEALDLLEAHPGYLLEPQSIRIDDRGRYPEIVGFGPLVTREANCQQEMSHADS